MSTIQEKLAIVESGGNPNYKNFSAIYDDYLGNEHGGIIYPNFQKYLELNYMHDYVTYGKTKILWYQTTENLRKFLQELNPPDVDPNDMTWKQLIWYITEIIKPKFETITNFFSKCHLTYPDREKLVARYVKKNPYLTITYLDIKPTKDAVLSLPPLKLERDVLVNKLSVYGSQLVKLSIRQIRPDLTLAQFNQMIRDRSYEILTIHPDDFYRLTGLEFTWDQDTLSEFTAKPEFWLRTRWTSDTYDNLTDVFGDPLTLPCLSYGTLDNLKHYNISELIEAWKDGNYIHPDNPNLIFSEDDIYALKELIGHYPLHILRPLNMIFHSTTEQTLSELLSDLEFSDVSNFFLTLFLTGMVQRLWKPHPDDGNLLENTPINPYPHKTNETRGSTLEDIEIAMTPFLNSLTESLNTTVCSLGKLPVEYGTQSISQLVNSIRSENSCIAMASSLLITTAYNYLSEMKLTIPGFDYDEFQAFSTHR